MNHERTLNLEALFSPETDHYELAFTIGGLLLDYFQERGEIRRASEITDEWTQDDHFDQLSRLYCQVCELMGLPWPPPVGMLDAPADPTVPGDDLQDLE